MNAAKEIDATKLAEFGFAGDWEADRLRQPTTAGALLIGWEKGVTGSLATPPLGQALSAGNILVLRAASRDVSSGVMPVSFVAGAVTSCVAEVAVTKAARDCLIPMPALAASDRILIQSITNQSSRATFVYDLAICAPGAYQPETVVTNAATAATAVSDNTAEVTVPDDGANLWLEVCATYDGEDSDWMKPFIVTLSDSSDDGDDSDGDSGSNATGLDAPGNVRAGTLSDGNVRLGWTTPDGATNVQLRVWTLSSSGGLAAAKNDDILWRESFTNAPAANGNVVINNDDKFDLYADNGSAGWDASRCVQVALASEASAVKIGTTKNPGAIVSKPLAASGDGLSLVVTAKRGSGMDNSGVVLRPSLLSDAVTTNTLGQTTLSAEFAEYAFSISSPLTGTESLLLESVIGTPKDGRIIIDDIALVRGYSPISTTTNEVASVDLGASEEYDIAAASDGVVRYAALRAQDASGATSEWTPPLALDPSALGEWKPRYLTPDHHGEVDATLDWTSLPVTTETKLDVSDSPFRFLLDGNEQLTISRAKDATTSFSAGVYICTNVFARDWLVLMPYSTKYASVIKTAEMRVAIESGEFALRKVSVSGEFAQLGASNNVERTLLFQWRTIAGDGAATEWHDFGEYKTTYTAADAPSDLSGTVTNIMAEASPRASAGARVEVRVLSERQKDQKIAPLGFRDFRIRAESASRAILFIVR